MIGQVVVGIDGSPNSLAAFQYGLDLARRVKAEVKVVFVVDSRKTDLPIIYTASHFDYGFERVYIPPEPGLKGFYDKVRNDIRAFGENCMAKCRKDAESVGVPLLAVLREGLPSGILGEEARSGDLLVLGQKGENAHIQRAIVGSTTEDVVRSSPRPVLICPAAFKSPAPRPLPLRWKSGRGERAAVLRERVWKHLAGDRRPHGDGRDGRELPV